MSRKNEAHESQQQAQQQAHQEQQGHDEDDEAVRQEQLEHEQEDRGDHEDHGDRDVGAEERRLAVQAEQGEANEDGAERTRIERQELADLKAQASDLGVSFHPSIKTEKLREKIEIYLARNPARDPKRNNGSNSGPNNGPARANVAGTGSVPSSLQVADIRDEERLAERRNAPRLGDPLGDGDKERAKRERLVAQRQEATRLVRIRVTNMNPMKKDWQGEIITVSNSVVGTHRKYVPFNAEEGWHVPNIIYQVLKARMCQIFVNARDDRGNPVKKSKLVPEFAIEELDPLTPAEIDDLAKRQAMSGSTATA